MPEDDTPEPEPENLEELRVHLQRIKRLKRLHARVHERLTEEIEALEERIRKHDR